MIIFPIIILISLVLYVYFKVAILRTSDPLVQLFINSKARISLGIFIAIFGINQYLYYETSIALYVTIVFLILGTIQFYSGMKRYSHYKKELNKSSNKE
ncbi:hypothetical protein GH741_09225 [Aquibacillus halophilus]|uniref:YtpI-like protein n=1 Tax=Aquibacillus halophilus TaxID=930132 RepID=A0A6A8DEC9_9BACI|nr:YtpI family protein [Aquibacillus halophilus]MRH42866.1 hypothetical protein [Aquibacillus halophilus]